MLLFNAYLHVMTSDIRRMGEIARPAVCAAERQRWRPKHSFSRSIEPLLYCGKMRIPALALSLLNKGRGLGRIEVFLRYAGGLRSRC